MGFFSKRRNKIIKEKIEHIFRTSNDYEDTNIHWEAFVRFAQEHGGRIDKYADGGQDTGFEMTVFDDNQISEEFLELLYCGRLPI